MMSVPQSRALPAPDPSRACVPKARTLRGAILAALALAAAALLAAAPAAATMYKWVDKSGRVVYSDQPPPPDVKAEIVKPPPPPANTGAAQDLANKELEIRQRDKKRAEDAQSAERNRADADRRRENCTQARGQLRTLQLANQDFFRFDEKGERVLLDDQARKALIEQLQQVVRDNCS
jgi:hypothetical protein